MQFNYPDANGRPYKSSGGRMSYNEKLGCSIPEGWDVASIVNNPLTDVITPGVDLFKTKTYYATADVNGMDIGTGSPVNYETRESRANMQPRLHTVWFAKMKNSVKHLFLGHSMEQVIEESILSTGFMGLQCKEAAFEYISAFIDGPYFERAKDQYANGATQQAVGNAELESVYLVVPDDETLARFHELTRGLVESIGKTIIENKRLVELRDWLLPMLMNGQATVEATQPNYRLSNPLPAIRAMHAFVIIQCDSLARRMELHMKESLISDVLLEMKPLIDGIQLKQLETALQKAVTNYKVMEAGTSQVEQHADLLESFISAKRVEGCSERTLDYYRRTIEKMQRSIERDVRRITTEELRVYLARYQSERAVGKVTIDNVRRILSSFFSWLEDEDLILKSPVRRIHKVRTTKRVKETYTDEELETMRDASPNLRDLALIDLLTSTGMRVGEVTLLNRSDIDFENRECVVLGKGGKERTVYFDARTKIHLEQYLEHRDDQNPALFVALRGNHARLGIGGIESRLRKLGQELGIEKLHPHKFRRTLATMAIDKGMPVEQLQCLLGHQRIDTTLQYAMVKQSNVKLAHRRYLS